MEVATPSRSASAWRENSYTNSNTSLIYICKKFETSSELRHCPPPPLLNVIQPEADWKWTEYTFLIISPIFHHYHERCYINHTNYLFFFFFFIVIQWFRTCKSLSVRENNLISYTMFNIMQSIFLKYAYMYKWHIYVYMCIHTCPIQCNCL